MIKHERMSHQGKMDRKKGKGKELKSASQGYNFEWRSFVLFPYLFSYLSLLIFLKKALSATGMPIIFFPAHVEEKKGKSRKKR